MRSGITYMLYKKSLKIVDFINKSLADVYPKDNDVVLCYHDITDDSWEFSVGKDRFESHIKELQKEFVIVGLSELLSNKNETDKPRLSITFDDGHKGIIENALPVLEKYGLKAAVFITGRRDLNIKKEIEDKYLSMKEIQTLKNKGWTIGWHTNNHSNLMEITKAEQEYEINLSKLEYEKLLNIKFKYFAYPFGKFNGEVENIVENGDFSYAFGVDGGELQKDQKYSLARNTVDSSMSSSEVLTLVSPLGLIINRFFNKLWKIWDQNRFRYTKEAGAEKKIIISSFDDIGNPYYSGGGARSVHEIAKRLTKDHKVKIISGKYPGSKNEILDDIEYERIGVASFGPKLNQAIFHLLLIYKIIIEKYDLWIENFTPPISTSFLPVFTKKPVIGLVHMLSAEDMERKYKLPFRKIQNIGLKFYKHFIAVNKKDIQRIKKINSKADFVHIPNGVHIPRIRSSENKDILYMGRIEINQKGLDLLVKAFKNISSEVNSDLIIAGGGSDSEVEKLIWILKDVKLNGRVRLMGKVDENKKDKLFRSASCVALPSRYETFSITALESLSYGVPVVAYDIPGLKWIPEELTYKSEQFSISDFSQKLLMAIKEDQVSPKLIDKRIAYAKKYDWDAIEKQYRDYLSKFMT